jgi:hypothetical protein
MLYLLIGIMVGILLAYLSRRPWGSLRWWLAGAALIILLTPIVWESVRYGSGDLGVMEAVKDVLLPCAAGVGFGIWMYPIVVPQPFAREASASSFIPLAVAMLLVMLIVSEERYGWLDRLQRITVGGNAVELAARSSATKPQDTVLSKLGGAPTGEGRIGNLLYFLYQLPDTINRDKMYAKEVAYGDKKEEFQKDLFFAENVARPLGTRLRRIHAARGYNAIEFITDRPFVDHFRALVEGHWNGKAPASSGRGSGTKIVEGFDAIWSAVCEAERSLKTLGDIDIKTLEPDERKCEQEQSDGKEALNHQLGPRQTGIIFSHTLPYGTLLAAMLLNAAGEGEAAVKDLDRWVVDNTPNSPTSPDDSYRWFGVYRARYMSAQMAAENNLGDVAILQFKEVVALGDSLLMGSRPEPGTLSWRDQMWRYLLGDPPPRGSEPGILSWHDQIQRLEKGDGIDPIWLLRTCSHELTELFKRFIIAYLAASNNLAYYLSQDLPFTKHEGLDEMKKCGEDLATVNVHCLQLQDSLGDEQLAKATQATFLDTAAAVELALASEEMGRPEKQSRLCRARKYTKGNRTLHRNRSRPTIGRYYCAKESCWFSDHRGMEDTIRAPTRR